MRSIIETIYYEAIESDEIIFNKQHESDEEAATHKALRNALTKEQNMLFDRYEKLHFKQQCDSEKKCIFWAFAWARRRLWKS